MEIVKKIRGCYNLEVLDKAPTVLQSRDFEAGPTCQMRLFFTCARNGNVSVNFKNITDNINVGNRCWRHNIFHLRNILPIQNDYKRSHRILQVLIKTFQIPSISSQKDASCQTDHNELTENEFELQIRLFFSCAKNRRVYAREFENISR